MLNTLALITLTLASPVHEGKGNVPVPDVVVAGCIPQKPVVRAEEVSRPRMSGSTTLGLPGIDVSHYQGYIQWSRVVRDPQAGYVYLKATESSTWKDDTYHRNLREARQAGMKVGAYHFFSPSTSPMEQFRNMASTVKIDEQDLLPLIDVEKVSRAGSVVLRQRLKSFLQAVEKHYGVRPLIYTGYNFYRKHLEGHFKDYRFMIASYAEERPDFEVLDATVLMWQYSATGRVDGIKGNCDCSAFINGHKLEEILIAK